ncbi:MAG: hypothetical protein E7552_00440 [Ruminococcaceae bacterium]|nr:hypothetical protein [Oscillospiraceae bacterium]
MKQWIALLLCVWIAVSGAFAVSAKSTTTDMSGDYTQTEVITNTTVYYEDVEVEVVEKVHAPYPKGTSLALIILGGVLVIAAIALLCVFLFAFPRWGLIRQPATKNEVPAAPLEPAVSEEVPSTPIEETKEAPSTVSLEDLF